MSQRDTHGTPGAAPVRLDERGVPLPPGLSPTRRSFLKLAGFSVAGAMLSGCSRGIAHDAIPLLERPEEITPGNSVYYAGLCAGCTAGCGIVAKVRDGRPIKVEGNDLDPLSMGTTCAVGQAQVLTLYDARRLRGPRTADAPTSWEAVDRAVVKHLADVAKAGKSVRLLTGTVNGPTDRAAVAAFLRGHPGAKHVAYDTLSASAMRTAHERYHGQALTPRYRLEHAHVVVSIDADFLGPWLSPVEHTRGWHAARLLGPDRTSFLHHVQVESRVSLTGTNADVRHPVAPADLVAVLGGLVRRIAAARGRPAPWADAYEPELDAAVLDGLAERLLGAEHGRALVLCGLNDVDAQLLTCHLNHLLGADDPALAHRTVDLAASSQQKLGNDADLAVLLDELRAGTVGALVVARCNPVYDLPEGAGLGALLDDLDLVVSVSEQVDETAAHADFVCPEHHPLEGWRDAEPVRGTFTLGQPAIRPLGDTRALAESLSRWAGAALGEFELVRETWRREVLAKLSGGGDPERLWQKAVHDGSVRVPVEAPALQIDVAAVEAVKPPGVGAPRDGALGLVLYAKVGLPDGRHAHNPWLQELPDPVTKVSWDNYACLAPADAAARQVEDGDLVQVAAGGEGGPAVTLPAVVQRGQAPGTVAIALGYGRAGTDRFSKIGPEWLEGRETVEPGGTIGKNAASLLGWSAGTLAYSGASVRVTRTGKTARLARTQIHDSLDVPRHLAPGGKRRRDVAPHTTKKAFDADPRAGRLEEHPIEELWPDDHSNPGRHWGLAVDLSACTGCAACVVACQAENNVPVVGKDEVRRQREMHWLRIDRYFQGEGGDLQTIHQPMMCQQCDHAPCETVCPVLATVHSKEGLNQQVYNRCVGTRYCSNNCPYKVRRFNWFDYPREDRLQNLVLNPDVTVRSRGVMEKCTFCVQRIQEAKAAAKRDGRVPVDGDIRTACQQACPAGAIVFGDTNDPTSRVRAWMESPRAGRVLADLGVRPSVAYLTQVQDRESKGEPHD